ncbi:hypothetical protein LIER_17825 [Lithospermum erythrorhizon]|uniref:Protein kinase domain-containing protein n=1 Tax=Lithospermum erythrorhizon TaxID=34254 RepID=A0AAV3QDJ1_LITER
MAKHSTLLLFVGIIFWVFLASQVLGQTDELDLLALQEFYKSLNKPPQLSMWKSDGGDPCQDSWIGVECEGSSIIHLKLHGLNLSGNFGYELVNLENLKQLDLSSNNILGPISFSLPPNLTNLNLADNKFTGSIPQSLSFMTHLRRLNLSQNLLSGPLGDVFNGLENLREMDLSCNSFSGDLPSSFASTTNLWRLFLQSNQFTGSVIYLANLPLIDLNIEDNHFSGIIPENFQKIKNLWIGGNHFDIGANYTPWTFPSDVVPDERSIPSPPTSESNAISKHPSPDKPKPKKRRIGIAGIICTVGGVLMATCAAAFAVIRVRHSQKRKLRTLEGVEDSVHSLHVSTARDYSSSDLEGSPYLSSLNSPSTIAPWHLPPVRTRTMKVTKRKSFSSKPKIPISAKLYTVAELQFATNCFSEKNLLGEGSLGAVYRAEFPDGQIFAVKSLMLVPLSLNEEEQVLDAIRNTSRLRHPNIVRLVGYCVESGQHILVYEYIRNLTLEDALHCAAYTPLSWSLRLRIAFGVAQALDYLHSSIPPVMHRNLKAANILLDEDLTPRLCDCGLAILRSLTSNSVKLKASEMAIINSGYTAPEPVQPENNSSKADTYAFGVLLVELLTGRKPFDSSKPTKEQSLVKWASSRLHDNKSLIEMIDPALRRTISSKVLSSYADIVSLCIQPAKEFRPCMSEIVNSLKGLVQKHEQGDGAELDSLERSFRSTTTRFIGSPSISYYSSECPPSH